MSESAKYGVGLWLYCTLLCPSHRWEQAEGNPFAECVHDAGTLANKHKYQITALQWVDHEWGHNVVVGVGMQHIANGFDTTLRDTNDQSILNMSGHTRAEVVGSMRSDRAALSVARLCELEDEACEMHDGDKVGSAATGKLVRRKNNRVVNPFNEGAEVVKRAHAAAVFFAYSDRWGELCKLSEATTGQQVKMRLKVDKNTTRIASVHGLLHSLLRNFKPLTLYEQTKSPTWKLHGDWDTIAEFESVLHVTKMATSLAQIEKDYAGAYAGIIKRAVLNTLRKDEMAVIDLDKVSPDMVRPVRYMKKVRNFTERGKTCLTRAIVEALRRWCKVDTEVPTDDNVHFSDRELIAAVLDLRTYKDLPSLLERDVRKRAEQLAQDEYVRFGMKAYDYNVNKKAQLSHAASAPTASASTATAAQAPSATVASSQQEQEVQEVSQPQPQGHVDALAVGILHGESEWTDDEYSEDEVQDTAELAEEVATAARAAYMTQLEEEAPRVFRAWRSLIVDWKAEFPEECKEWPSRGPDPLRHLMRLDVGPLYKRIAHEDSKIKSPRYGLIPLMVSCSRGQIGHLNAESFCERVLSVCNDVLTDGNSLLGDTELCQLSLLRINTSFMEECRMRYGKTISKQLHNQTIVGEE